MPIKRSTCSPVVAAVRELASPVGPSRPEVAGEEVSLDLLALVIINHRLRIRSIATRIKFVEGGNVKRRAYLSILVDNTQLQRILPIHSCNNCPCLHGLDRLGKPGQLGCYREKNNHFSRKSSTLAAISVILTAKWTDLHSAKTSRYPYSIRFWAHICNVT